MKELLEYIVKSLATVPEEAAVDEQVLPDGLVVLSISANQADYGRLIGRQGMLIHALRTILKARAIKEKKKVMVRIMTDDDNRENVESNLVETVSQDALDDNLV